jgi:hypothetical protein
MCKWQVSQSLARAGHLALSPPQEVERAFSIFPKGNDHEINRALLVTLVLPQVIQ